MATGQLMFEVGIQKANDEYDKIYGEIMKLVELGKRGFELKVEFKQTEDLRRFVDSIKLIGDGKMLEPLLNKIKGLQESMVRLGMVPDNINYTELTKQLEKLTTAYKDYQDARKKFGLTQDKPDDGRTITFAKQYTTLRQNIEKEFGYEEKILRAALETWNNFGNTVASNLQRVGGSKAGMETLAHSVNDMASSVDSLSRKLTGLVSEMSKLGQAKGAEKLAGDFSDADKGTKQIAVALKQAMDKLDASKSGVAEAEKALYSSTSETNRVLEIEKVNAEQLAQSLGKAERAIQTASMAAKNLSVILGGNSEGVNKFVALASTMEALNLKQAAIMTNENLPFAGKKENLEAVRKEMDAVAKEMDELKKNAAVGNPLVEAFTTAFTSLNTALTNSGNLLSKAATGLGDVDEQLSKVMVKASKEIKLGGNVSAQKEEAKIVQTTNDAYQQKASRLEEIEKRLQELAPLFDKVRAAQDKLANQRAGYSDWIGKQIEETEALKNSIKLSQKAREYMAGATVPIADALGYGQKNVLKYAQALEKLSVLREFSGADGTKGFEALRKRIQDIEMAVANTKDKLAKGLFPPEHVDFQRKTVESLEYRLGIMREIEQRAQSIVKLDNYNPRGYNKEEHLSLLNEKKTLQGEKDKLKQQGAQAAETTISVNKKEAESNKEVSQSAKDVVAALKQKADAEKSAHFSTDTDKATKGAKDTTAAVNEEAEAFRKLMTEMNTFKGSIESLVGSIRSLVEQLQKMHTSTPQIIDNNALLAQAKVVEDLKQKMSFLLSEGLRMPKSAKSYDASKEYGIVEKQYKDELAKFNEMLTHGSSAVGSYAQAIQQLGQKYNFTLEQASKLASLIGSGELKRGDVQRGLGIGYNRAGDIVETINALKQLKQVESQPAPTAQSVFDQSKFTGLQEAIDKVIKEVNRLQEAFKHLGENNSLSNLSTTVNGLAVTLSTLSNAFKFTANTEELAAYEAKIKSLQQTISELEAKANGLVASAKQVNTEMKTIGESKGSEATYNKNLDKLQAALEKVKQSIDTVQPKRDAFKDAGLSDEVLEGKYNKLLAIRDALEKAMGNKDLLSKAGAISSIKLEGTDIMALGEMTKTLRSDKGVKQLAADFERLTANAEQSRQSIQLVMQRPIEGDMLEQVVAKNKERLAEIRKYIVDEFRYLKEQMKLASKEGIDITPAIADRTRLRNEVQELGASFKQVKLENTKEVDNLMKAYIRLFAQVNAQSNILRQGVFNKKGGYEAEIERARVAYALLLKDTDQLRIKREQLSKSGQDTSALDAQIQKAKEFLYILDRIQKRGFYGDFTTASILRSADFKTIAPYAWDEIQKGQEQARQDKAAQREAERQEKLAQKQAEAIRAAEEAKRNERNKAWMEQDAQRKKELEAIEKQGAKTLQAQQAANEKALASAQKADEQKAKSAENAAKRREEANERATIKEREAVLRKEQELYQKQANKAANDRTKSASDAVVEYKRLEDIITRLNALGVKAIGANVDTTKVDDLIHRLEILQRIYKNIYEGGGRDAAGRSFGDIKGVDQVRATMLDIRSIFTEIPQKIRESEQATKLVANAERSIQSEIDKTLSLRKKIEASIARGEAAGRDMSGLKAQNAAIEQQINLLKAVRSGLKSGSVSPTDDILAKRIQETKVLREDTELLRKSQEKLNAAQEKANKDKDKQAAKNLKEEIKSVDEAWEKYNKLGVEIKKLQDQRERGINANIDTSSVTTYINHLEQLRTLLKEIFSYNGRTLSTGSIGSANFTQGMLFKDVMKNWKGAALENTDKYNMNAFSKNLTEAESNMRKAERAAAALDVKIQNIEARKLDFKDLDTSRLDAAIQRLREIQAELQFFARKGSSTIFGTNGMPLTNAADIQKAMGLATVNREVTNATKELQAAQTSAASAVRQMAIEEQRLDKALHEVNNSAKTQSQMMSDLKMMATQYLGVWGAQQFFRNIIEIGGQLEKQRLSLRAILGDAAQAEELFSDIKKLAIKSPFGVVELDQFTKQLSAYGFKYNELFDMTKRLADISAGAGTEVSRLALALGHVRAEGALSGYTLRQFAMNNIPMVQKLAERFTQLEGKIVSVSEIRKRVSKKEIGYEDVEAVIKDLTNEGGMFYNMQEVISESVQAKFKNLKDSMDIMYGEMAQGNIGEILKAIANTLTDLTRQWKVLLPVIGAATAYWGMQKLAVMGVNAQITKYGVAAKVLTGQTYKLTAEQVKNLAVTGQISKRQLLIAVASRRLTVEQAELAASTQGLSRAQLQEVFSSGAVDKALLGSAAATSKYTIAQLRAMAATKVTATGIVWIDGALTRVKRAWLGASAAASKFGMTLKAMSTSVAWLAAIELLVTAIAKASQKASERTDRMKSMLETAREGFKNMNQNAVNFKVGVSLDLNESELRTQIDAMKQELKEYSPQVGNVFDDAFKTDKSGKSIHSMSEQYEILAKAIQDTKDAYKEFEKISDFFELANDKTDGLFDDSLRENIVDYIDAIKEQRREESNLLKDRVKLSTSIENLRKNYENFDKVIIANAASFKSSGGKYGFAEDDIIKQIELIKSYGEEYTKNVEKIRKGSKDYVGDEEAKKLEERKRIYDDFFRSYGNGMYAYDKAVMNSQNQWKEVVADGATFTADLVKRLEGVFKKSASEFNKAEQLAVQKGIQTFLNGIDGFKDLAREERVKIEKELLKPFPNIKIDVEVEDAYQQLSNFQQYLQSITSKAWTVNIKTLNTISDVAEAARKNRKENKQTIKDTSGIIKKSPYDDKRLKALAKDLYEEGKIQDATEDAVEATEGLNNALKTEWGGMQVQANKTEKGLSKAQKAINKYIDGMKDASEEEKLAARNRIQAYASEEVNIDMEERGYDLSDNKSKNKSEDKKAKEMREQIKLIKDAYDWYKKYDDELKWSPIDAFAEIKSKYGKTLGKLGIKWDDEKKGISEYRDSLQLLLDKAEQLYKQPKHKNSYMMDVIKELKDAIQQTDFDNLKKKAEDTASAMAKILNNLAQQWSVYKDVLSATGNKGLARQLAGMTGARQSFQTLADELQGRISVQASNVDFSKVFDMYDKEIKEYVGTLGVAKDKIDAIINALKEWKKVQTDVIKADITSFASLIGSLKDYETEINKIDTELANRKEANERLATTINPETGKPYITKEQQVKADKIAETDANDKSCLSALYINLINNSLGLTKTTIEEGIVRAQEILNEKFSVGLISAKEYAEEMAKIRDLQQGWDKGTVFGKNNALTSYLTGGETGMRNYVTNTRKAYETKRANKEKTTAAEDKQYKNAVDTEKGMNKLDKSVGKTKVIFDSLANTLQPVIDIFNQLGMTGVGQVVSGVQGAMSGAASGGMAAIAAFGSAAGPYGAAIGAGLSVASSVLGGILSAHDDALQDEIDASKQRQKEMERLSKNVEKVLGNVLGGLYTFTESKMTEKDREDVKKEYERRKVLSDKADQAGMAATQAKGFAITLFSQMSAAYRKEAGPKETVEAFKRAAETQEYYDIQRASLLAQRDELIRQREAEQDKKDSDNDAIDNYNQQIREIQDSLKTFALDMAKSLYNIDLKDWASQLTDAVVEAWEKGENAAEAYRKKVREIVKDLTKNMLSQKVVEKMFSQIGLDTLIEDMMDKNSGVLNEKNFMDLADKMNEVAEISSKIITGTLDAMDKKHYIDKGDSSSGLSSNIKTITEQTADLLASYVNAIRADVAVNRSLITQYFPMYYSAMTAGNENLKHIETYTEAIMRSNDAIRQSNQDLLDMVKGLKNNKWAVPVS